MHFLSNRISSSRYTWLNFLPKSLFEQFQRITNLWFLFVTIFQLLAIDDTTERNWTTVAPLAVLICLKLLKDGYHDLKRHQGDRLINSRLFEVWMKTSWREVCCEDLRVGNYVLLREGSFAPADLVVVATSLSEHICYIDTSRNLGNSDLMIKRAAKETVQRVSSLMLDKASRQLNSLNGMVKLGEPEADFNILEATIKLPRSPKAVPLGADNLIARGSVVRIAPWVIGLVAYTGAETKLFLNSLSSPVKCSTIERKVNSWVKYILCGLLVLVICFALCSMYVSITEDSSTDFPRRFIVFCLLYNNIIPISLFVSLDLIRLMQVLLMTKDPDFSGEIDFNSADMNEDLGQVEYIFLEPNALSDSSPVVEVLIIGDEEYLKEVDDGLDVPVPSKNVSREFRQEEFIQSTEANQQLISDEARTYLTSDQSPDPKSFEMLKQVGTANSDPSFDHFFQCFAMCTSFIPNDEFLFLTASREDEVIVQTLKEIGSCLDGRNSTRCDLSLFGRKYSYEIVAYWESTPDTQRTRIIVQPYGEDRGFLYVKGPLVTMGNILGVSSNEYKRLEKTVRAMSVQGLSATIAGCVELSAEKMTTLKGKFESAQLAVANVDSKMNKVFEELEEEEIIKYLGIVGISIPAQEDAKEALRVFAESGIKVWLTSTFSTTSVLQAAYNAGLIRAEDNVVKLESYQGEDVLQKELARYIYYCIASNEKRPTLFNTSITESGVLGGMGKKKATAKRRISQRVVLPNETFPALSYSPSALAYHVLIDGTTLELALHSTECKRLLAYFLFCAQSVCGSSLLPKQKQQLVHFVKENFSFHPVTLAVASDSTGAAMMQVADIGVALKNRNTLIERVCDIVIGRVGLLRVLIVKHGQWNYWRASKVVLLFLFKNILLVTVLVWYTLVDDYTGTVLLDSSLTACFNILFTSLPIIYIGIFDHHISTTEILNIPGAYQHGVLHPALNRLELLRYILLAVLQALLLIALLYPAVLPVLNDGYTESFASIGTLFFINIVIVVNAAIAVETHLYSVGFAVTCCVSLGLLYLYIGVASVFPQSELFDVLHQIFSASTYVLSIFMGSLGCFVVSYSVFSYRFLFTPSIINRYRITKIFDISFLLRTYVPSRLSSFQSHLHQLYHSTTSKAPVPVSDAYALNPITLRFASPYIESKYRLKFLKTHLRLIRGVTLLLWLAEFVWMVVSEAVGDSRADYAGEKAVISLLFLCLFGVTFWKRFQEYYREVVLGVIFVTLMAKFGAELMHDEVGGMVAALAPIISYILLNVDFLAVTVLNLLNIVLFTISGAYISSREEGALQGILRILCYEVLLFGVTFISCRAGYILEKANRMEYTVKSRTKREVEKSRNILSLLLPSFVISQVKDREIGKYIAEDQGDVTVIFCDIYDFDTICSLYKPQELTAFLDDVFQQFDGLCQLNGVVKIETVGKTYMACAGLGYVDADLPIELKGVSHARRAAEFSFDLLRAAKGYKIKNGKPLQLKIGINSGPVISGVVGYHKPQFSLVGDTVNTASRMCSTIEKVNSIQITSETRHMMTDSSGILFEAKKIWAKGKGDMTAFVITEEGEVVQRPSDLGSPGMKTHLMRRRTEFFEKMSKTERGSMELEADEQLKSKAAELRWNPFWPLFTLYESEEEAQFRVEAVKQTRSVRKWNLASTALVQLLLFALRVAQYAKIPDVASSEVLIAYAIIAIIPLLYLLLPEKFYEIRLYLLIQLLLFIAIDVLILFDLIFETSYDSELVAIQLIHLMLLSSWSGLNFAKSATCLALLMGVSWLVLTGFVDNWGRHLIIFAFLAIYFCVNNYALYVREYQMRLYAHLKQIEDQEIGKNEKLLGQMMPKSVYEKLKKDLPVTDKLRNMSILFADIVGFTNWSSDKRPEQVVGMLSALFTEFDLLCVRFHIYKVHTIGDCYVVMGFDGASESFDPSLGCLRVLCMGHEMIRVIREVNEREGIGLNMRIGIHTGDVIAGITGKDVIRYDIYGPAVMVANKMESGGGAGRVNVSEVTREVLERMVPDLLEYSENQVIEAKGIYKKFASYFVHVKDEERLLSRANSG